MVGELADGFAFLLHLSQQSIGRRLAKVANVSNNLGTLPKWAVACLWLDPDQHRIRPFKQVHFATAGFDDSCVTNSIHRWSLGLRQSIRTV